MFICFGFFQLLVSQLFQITDDAFIQKQAPFRENTYFYFSSQTFFVQHDFISSLLCGERRSVQTVAALLNNLSLLQRFTCCTRRLSIITVNSFQLKSHSGSLRGCAQCLCFFPKNHHSSSRTPPWGQQAEHNVVGSDLSSKQVKSLSLQRNVNSV